MTQDTQHREPALASAVAEPSYAALRARFQPIFERIAAGQIRREQQFEAPREQLQWLIDAGFAGLRVPRQYGGEDVRLADVLRLIAELAEFDPNLAHIWRNHVSFIEDRRHDGADPRSGAWLRRLGRGEIVGGGWSEPAQPGAPVLGTRLAEEGGVWRLTGKKYYCTGSTYADWLTVLALDSNEETVVVLVDAHAPGVTVEDDWDGFGQRLTGSGSVTYDDVIIDPERVFPYAVRYPYQGPYYQGVLNALVIGIGRATLRDGIEALRARIRSHRNAASPEAASDAQLLEVIGRISQGLSASEALFERSLAALDALADGTDSRDPQALERAWVSTAETQLTASEAVLFATNTVFDALGASGTSSRLGLDAHWRNARTLISHNPRVYKWRLLGDLLVNGVSPIDAV